MKAVAAGDPEAFTLLFRRYQRPVFQFTCRMTSSAEVAEDLTQECFVRVLKSAKHFDPARGSLRVYLFAAARNLVIRDAQKRSATAPASSENDSDDDRSAGTPDRALGPEALLLGSEDSEAVRRAVSRLPSAQREALVLVEYEDLSLEDAAQVLEIDVGAVKSRVHRARENLKRLLAPYFGCERSGQQKEKR